MDVLGCARSHVFKGDNDAWKLRCETDNAAGAPPPANTDRVRHILKRGGQPKPHLVVDARSFVMHDKEKKNR